MIDIQYPWEPPPPKPDKLAARPSRRARGRIPGQANQNVEPGWLGVAAETGQGAATSNLVGPRQVVVTDWLYHRLTISGPDDQVSAFASAAAGAGVVPWRLDLAALEEDLFHRLLTGCPRSRLSVDGCRAFAGQFREAVEARQARAGALVGRSRACPFDLHALLPVPARVLALGPEDPAAHHWLRTHWGTTALRQVAGLPPLKGRSYLPPGHRAVRFGFFAADWSPWQALRQIRTTWPALRLVLQPVYERA